MLIRVNKKINKKGIVVIFFIAIVTIGCFIWFKESGTNKELPKKATFVYNTVSKGDYYR